MSFLRHPELTADGQRLLDDDVVELGHVMNLSRLWAYQPATMSGLFDLMRQAISPSGLTFRQKGVLVVACASALGDSYCSLAWGRKLAAASDERTAVGVLRGSDDGLSPAERALAAWARKVARDPNGTGEADVRELRDAGYGDDEIFAITVFVALRIAFSTINDALGALPDHALRTTAPGPVLDAVTYGRPIETVG